MLFRSVELIDWDTFETMEVPEGGVDLTLNLGWEGENWIDNEELKDVKDGDTLYILHQKADGTWEVLEGTAVVTEENGYKSYSVAAHFDSLSPVAVIKIMSNGEVTILDENIPDEKENVKKVINPTNAKGDSTKVVKTTTVKKSPKTGN